MKTFVDTYQIMESTRTQRVKVNIYARMHQSLIIISFQILDLALPVFIKHSAMCDISFFLIKF